jgi:nicotinamide-nucleotide amidase
VEDEDLATRVVELLNGRAIATAESCTAGRVAEVLACVDDASTFLRGGVVAYQEAVKRDLLHVTAESVLTSQAAEQMAVGVARLLDAQVAVSTTGVAGDQEQDGTPPGTVFIGIAIDGAVTSSVHQFGGTPQEICDHARRQALLDLAKALSERH